MLFRQRVSFQGALKAHRRACGEMAAYNARADVHHGANSLRQPGSLSSSTSPSTVNHDHQPAFPLTQRATLTKDCRWKRGRPLTFSSRILSTKQADLTTQADVLAVGATASGITRQAHEDQDVEIPLIQLRQQPGGPGDAATATRQYTCADCSPCAVSNDHVADIQNDRATESSTFPAKAPAADATRASLNIQKASSGDMHRATSDTNVNFEPASPVGSMLDDTTDTDYLQSFGNESASKPEQDVPKADEADEADEEPSETHTPLEFQIPEDILRAAMTAPENTKASFWSTNLYRGPENKKILVHYCKTKEVAEKVAQYFVDEKVVGFDIEWKSYAHAASIKGNVSLIQLACEDRVALFHVALFSGFTAAQLMPSTLKKILESPDIYKVGVAVKGDFSRIVKFLQIEPQGVFELSRLHNLVQFSTTEPSRVTKKLVSLAAQVQQHLQLPLYKGGKLIDDPDDTYNVRSGDWSLPLNHQQIHYAVADAYAVFRLYDVLEAKRKKLKPTPPRPLVCDYDNKPKPKSSDSKPRKKRKSATKTDDATSATVEEAAAPTEQEEEPEDEVEEERTQSQGTEGYETAQEDLLDSHQLEGEESQSSHDGYESTDGSEDDMLADSASSPKIEETARATDPTQRRVGRIDLSRLKGPDPGYPRLPNLRSGEETDASSDEYLVDMSENSEAEDIARSRDPEDLSNEDQETDEFDDSELEEALQDLTINSDGELQEDTNIVGTVDSNARNSTFPSESSVEANMTLQRIESHTIGLRFEVNEAIALHNANTTQVQIERSKRQVEDIKRRIKATQPAPQAPTINAADTASDKEEQRLIDLLNDPEATEYLHTPAQQPTPSPSIQPPTKSTTEPKEENVHTPEYDLATRWAHSYLSLTIPSPTSPAPSHIRATIPHLRAYNMWHHQSLSLSEIARHLRDPPLSESTVGSYVLQAITLEKMDYDGEAVRGLLMGMPEALRKGKWRRLSEKVGAK